MCYFLETFGKLFVELTLTFNVGRMSLCLSELEFFRERFKQGINCFIYNIIFLKFWCTVSSSNLSIHQVKNWVWVAHDHIIFWISLGIYVDVLSQSDITVLLSLFFSDQFVQVLLVLLMFLIFSSGSSAQIFMILLSAFFVSLLSASFYKLKRSHIFSFYNDILALLHSSKHWFQ